MKMTLRKKKARDWEIINGISQLVRFCYVGQLKPFSDFIGLSQKKLWLNSLLRMRNHLQVGAFADNFSKEAKIQVV